MLRYGVKVKAGCGENTETVWLIDWKHPEKNHFAIAEEVTVAGATPRRTQAARPGALRQRHRARRPGAEALDRLGRRGHPAEPRQPEEGSSSSPSSRRCSGDRGQRHRGLRYGTIQTPEKYYLTWKEDEPPVRRIRSTGRSLQLCDKARLLELIHDFIVFDAGMKKLCRHNQYFGVQAAQDHVRRREGGIIWHTQGCGKSLTMVWLAKWIRENVTDARVLIITDRTELDEQIEKVFKGVNEDIYRTKSGADLITSSTPPRPG